MTCTLGWIRERRIAYTVGWIGEREMTLDKGERVNSYVGLIGERRVTCNVRFIGERGVTCTVGMGGGGGGGMYCRLDKEEDGPTVQVALCPVSTQRYSVVSLIHPKCMSHSLVCSFFT